jgi:hypothetical protein
MAVEQIQHCHSQRGKVTIASDSLVKNDSLDRGVKTRTEHKETEGHNENVGDGLGGSEWRGEKVTTVEVIVGHGPEDEAIERVESSRHDGQKVSHTRNDAVGLVSTSCVWQDELTFRERKRRPRMQ